MIDLAHVTNFFGSDGGIEITRVHACQGTRPVLPGMLPLEGVVIERPVKCDSLTPVAVAKRREGPWFWYLVDICKRQKT